MGIIVLVRNILRHIHSTCKLEYENFAYDEI
jgi:hypothetical protein